MHFYTDYGVSLQKRFLGHFLKGEDTGWDAQPKVLLQIRHVDKFVPRAEQEWPLARTQWTKFYLHPDGATLSADEPKQAGRFTYEAMGENPLFLTAPFTKETEITGPVVGQNRPLVIDDRCRSLPCAASFRSGGEGSDLPLARTTHALRSASAGYALRNASSISARTKPYRPFTRMTKSRL